MAKANHILSRDMPNGLSGIYEKVNEIIFEGRGQLKIEQPGLEFGSFTAMDTLNDGAHVSSASFLTCVGIVQHPEYIAPKFVEHYRKHLTTYCDYLNYMCGMFKAAKPKQHVLEGVRSLHEPASYWKEQQGKARGQGA